MKKNLLFASLIILFAGGCGQEVKMVDVEPSSMSFTDSTKTDNIEAKALDMRSAQIPNISFIFSSENSNIASVSPDGIVKPMGNGSTAIVAKTKDGIQGECFVKVCLPKEIICEPGGVLNLRVGTAAPIKCYVTDCKDEKLQAKIDFKEANSDMVLLDDGNTFIGKAVGDTSVAITSLGLETKVKIHIDEQIFSPGQGPSTGGGGGGGGGKNKSKNSQDGKGAGRFDHILGNMKF